jgi:hypothetical protein
MEYFEKAEINISESVGIRKNHVSENSELKRDLANSIIILGRIQGRLGKYTEADSNFNIALKLMHTMGDSNLEKNKWLVSRIYKEYGDMLLFKHDFPQSEVLFNKSYNLNKELAISNPNSYKPELSIILNEIAISQQYQRKFEKSEANFLESLAINKELSKLNPFIYEPKVALTLFNLSTLCSDISQYKRAESYIVECIKIYRDLATTNPLAYNNLLASSLHYIGNLYSKMNNKDSSIVKLIEAINLYKELDSINPKTYKGWYARSIIDLAWEKYQTDLTKAINLADESIEICKPYADSDATIRSVLALCYGRMSRFQLFSKQFGEAEKYSLLAIKYYDNKVYVIKKNLAHSLLYQGKFKEAEKIYIELKDKPNSQDKSKTFKDVLIQDLDELEKAGITHPDIAKIRTLLNQKE